MRQALILICLVCSFAASADVSRQADIVNPNKLDLSSWQLKDLVLDDAGFLVNTSTDGFFKTSGLNLPRNQACYFLMDLAFKEPLFRPAMFELFWSTSPDAFAESQKARFLIGHEDTEQPARFIVPLCKLYRFSGNLNSPNLQENIKGLRFDFPVNRTVGLKISEFRLLSGDELESVGADAVWLEPYERIPGKAFVSKDAVIAKLFFGLEDGLKRLSNDLGFLIFWLILIAGCIVLIIRSYPRGDSGQG